MVLQKNNEDNTGRTCRVDLEVPNTEIHDITHAFHMASLRMRIDGYINNLHRDD